VLVSPAPSLDQTARIDGVVALYERRYGVRITYATGPHGSSSEFRLLVHDLPREHAGVVLTEICSALHALGFTTHCDGLDTHGEYHTARMTEHDEGSGNRDTPAGRLA